MLLFHCILTLMYDLFKRENLVFKQQVYLYFCIVGLGKTGPTQSSPPLQNLPIFLFIFSVFWMMQLFECILTIWITYSKVRIKFSILQDYWYFYLVGWGKTGQAHSSPPLSKMLGSVNLLFSLSVYVTLWLYLNNFEWPIPKRDQVFKPTS